MKWKWSLLAVSLAALLILGIAPGVRAMEEWCEDDPLVVITTPGGAAVPVYVTNGGLGLVHLPAVQLAQISYTVQPIQGGQATLVKMRVVIPGDAFSSNFPTRSTVSMLPWGTGTVYASASGYATQAMDMTFQLGVG